MMSVMLCDLRGAGSLSVVVARTVTPSARYAHAVSSHTGDAASRESGGR